MARGAGIFSFFFSFLVCSYSYNFRVVRLFIYPFIVDFLLLIVIFVKRMKLPASTATREILFVSLIYSSDE